MQIHQLINQDSGNTEWYTPISIINKVREVMGDIDLDPASSSSANKNIGSKQFYTSDDDVLNLPWIGRIWMNHPFSRINNPLFINKLTDEYRVGNITEACCITYASTSESWFRPLMSYPQCFIHGRTNYYLPDGTLKKGVSKGSVITYLGKNIGLFSRVFSEIGTVKI